MNVHRQTNFRHRNGFRFHPQNASLHKGFGTIELMIRICIPKRLQVEQKYNKNFGLEFRKFGQQRYANFRPPTAPRFQPWAKFFEIGSRRPEIFERKFAFSAEYAPSVVEIFAQTGVDRIFLFLLFFIVNFLIETSRLSLMLRFWTMETFGGILKNFNTAKFF